MPDRTVLEINKANILYNLNYFRSLLNPGTKLMVMVKAFGYGHGNPEISKILEKEGVEYLGVAFSHEGVALRKAGITTPVLVMNPHHEYCEEIVINDLEPEIYNLKILIALARYTKSHSKSLRIHLKIETGMNRLGFDRKDLKEMLDILKVNQHLKVAGVLSHLSSSELEEEKEFTIQQIQKFQEIYDIISAELAINPDRHILNTAGIIHFPEYQFEMVRLGIGIYGVDRDPIRKSPLKTVCTLKTIISQIKTLKKGETVGYGRAGVVGKDNTTIATVAMGYADGIYRNLGNGQGKVWIKGQWAPTLGNICMDMFMIDVSGLSVKEGDEVEIFGENQPIETLAEAADTIPYEVFTSIGERVKRDYV